MKKNEIKILLNSRNLKEMRENIPLELPEIFLFFPTFVFILTPLFQLVKRLLYPLDDEWGFDSTYSDTVSFFIQMGAIIAVIGIVLFVLRKDISKRIKPESTYLFFLLSVLLMIISTIVNGYTSYAAVGDIYRGENIFRFISYFVVFFFCSSLIKTKIFKKIVIYEFILVSIPIGIAALIDKFAFKIPAFKYDVGMSSIFYQFNHYGYFLLITILLCSAIFIREENKFIKMFSFAVFLFNNIILIMNDTFGAWLAVAVALVFETVVISICDKNFSKISLIPIVVFLFIAFVMGFWYTTVFSQVINMFKDIFKIASDSDDAGTAGTGRWTLWVHTVKYISEKPFLGWGVDGIHERLALETNGCNNRPHNEFLQYAAFFGIPCAISYICGLLSLFIRACKERSSMSKYEIVCLIAAFGYLVSSFFGNTMYYTAPFFFIFLGLSFGISEEK